LLNKVVKTKLFKNIQGGGKVWQKSKKKKKKKKI